MDFREQIHTAIVWHSPWISITVPSSIGSLTSGWAASLDHLPDSILANSSSSAATERRICSLGVGTVPQAGTEHTEKIMWPANGSDNAACSFQWRVVVMGEMTADLEIRAVMKRGDHEDSPKDVVLQKNVVAKTLWVLSLLRVIEGWLDPTQVASSCKSRLLYSISATNSAGSALSRLRSSQYLKLFRAQDLLQKFQPIFLASRTVRHLRQSFRTMHIIHFS